MTNQTKKFTVQNAQSSIHMGEMLKTNIESKRIFKSVLARKMNRSDSTILNFQKSKTMHTAILIELTHALKHNFFRDIANTFPAEYSSNTVIDSQKDNRIAQLEQQILILEAEKAVLLSALH